MYKCIQYGILIHLLIKLRALYQTKPSLSILEMEEVEVKFHLRSYFNKSDFFHIELYMI